MADYYGDPEDTGSTSTATATAAPETEKKDEGETKTAVIDSAICPGMEPGEEMVVKIDKVLDGQYLVSYAPEPEKEEEAPAEDEVPAPAPGGSLSSMME